MGTVLNDYTAPRQLGPHTLLWFRYVRLELLEGVGAYHAGDKARAKAALDGALAKWERLQVSDERLAELLAMGFTSSEVQACPPPPHPRHSYQPFLITQDGMSLQG